MKLIILLLTLLTIYSKFSQATETGPVYNFNFYNGEAGKNAPQVPLAPGQNPAATSPQKDNTQTTNGTKPEKDTYVRSWGIQIGYEKDWYKGSSHQIETSGFNAGMMIPLGYNYFLFPQILTGNIDRAHYTDQSGGFYARKFAVQNSKSTYNGLAVDLGSDIPLNRYFALSIAAFYKNISAKTDASDGSRDGKIGAQTYGLKLGPKLKGNFFELAFNGHYGLAKIKYSNIQIYHHLGTPEISNQAESGQSYGFSSALTLNF
ncbi:MAG: hypothetical protein ACOYL6_15800 [Bacteriovoracaceae bacterium]